MSEESLRYEPDVHRRHRYALMAGAAAIGTVAVLIVLKFVAWIATGSASVLASLIDSIIDAGASTVNFLAIRYALKPADEDHRYGHGKAEGLAALFQAAMIAGGAFFLLLEACSKLFTAAPMTDHMLAVGVMGVSLVLSILLVGIQKYALKQAPSLAVEADSAHYSTDIIVNAGTIAAVLAMYVGGPSWIDPVFALVVMGYLAKTAWGIAAKGADMLMDRELPEEKRERISGIVLAHPDVLGMHDLRTRQMGMNLHISFDIEIDPDKTLCQAHAVAKAVEADLLREFPHAEIMIHQDPAGDVRDSRHPRLTAGGGI